jgi:AraC-like DNA-binding protein
MEAQFMDPLSDICSFLEVKNLMTGQVRLGGSWAIRNDGQLRRHVALTVASKGSYWLSVDGVDAPIHIQEGDCHVLTYPSHCLRSERETKSVPIAPFSGTDFARSLKGIEAAFPFSNEPMNIIDGARLILDEAKAGPFFGLLPPVIHVRAESTQAPVLRSVLSVLVDEAQNPGPGGQLKIESLVRILLVEALRTCVTREGYHNGYLGALVDTKIGAALAVMHRDVTKRLTVDHIATAVGMSRSSFALRFKVLVGQSPLDYRLQLNMRRAAQLLRSNSSKTVSSVAYELGYESDRSFRKAFKRVIGCPPASYRKTDTELCQR